VMRDARCARAPMTLRDRVEIQLGLVLVPVLALLLSPSVAFRRSRRSGRTMTAGRTSVHWASTRWYCAAGMAVEERGWPAFLSSWRSRSRSLGTTAMARPRWRSAAWLLARHRGGSSSEPRGRGSAQTPDEPSSVRRQVGLRSVRFFFGTTPGFQRARREYRCLVETSRDFCGVKLPSILFGGRPVPREERRGRRRFRGVSCSVFAIGRGELCACVHRQLRNLLWAPTSSDASQGSKAWPAAGRRRLSVCRRRRWRWACGRSVRRRAGKERCGSRWPAPDLACVAREWLVAAGRRRPWAWATPRSPLARAREESAEFDGAREKAVHT
jgi:hypothetical protein